MLCAIFVFSLASVCFAADEDFARYGVRVRGLYVMPTEKIDVPGVTVDNAATPELDLEYFITRHFSTELVLALSKHDVSMNGANIGSLWLLPPSLLVKYHPLPQLKVSPYVGFGMNVVMPFDEKLSIASFKVSSSVGWAAQIGADIAIAKNIYLNVDVKYYDTGTTATIGGVKHDLDLDPFLFGTGIQVRF
jgi:outer membrane protein